MVIKRLCLSIVLLLSLNSCTIIWNSSINGQATESKKPQEQSNVSTELRKQVVALIDRIREMESQRSEMQLERRSTIDCEEFKLPEIPPAPPMPNISPQASDDEFSKVLVEYVVDLSNHSDSVISKIQSAYDRYVEKCGIQ